MKNVIIRTPARLQQLDKEQYQIVSKCTLLFLPGRLRQTHLLVAYGTRMANAAQRHHTGRSIATLSMVDSGLLTGG